MGIENAGELTAMQALRSLAHACSPSSDAWDDDGGTSLVSISDPYASSDTE